MKIPSKIFIFMLVLHAQAAHGAESATQFSVRSREFLSFTKKQCSQYAIEVYADIDSWVKYEVENYEHAIKRTTDQQIDATFMQPFTTWQAGFDKVKNNGDAGEFEIQKNELLSRIKSVFKHQSQAMRRGERSENLLLSCAYNEYHRFLFGRPFRDPFLLRSLPVASQAVAPPVRQSIPTVVDNSSSKLPEYRLTLKSWAIERRLSNRSLAREQEIWGAIAKLKVFDARVADAPPTDRDQMLAFRRGIEQEIKQYQELCARSEFSAKMNCDTGTFNGSPEELKNILIIIQPPTIKTDNRLRMVTVITSDANRCLSVEEGGLYGGFVNSCNFSVEYNYCVKSPAPDSWSDLFNCDKSHKGAGIIRANGRETAHNRGSLVHWLACEWSSKSGPGPTGVFYNPVPPIYQLGRGIIGSCGRRDWFPAN